MDTTTIIIVIAAVALIGFWLYNRSKPAPRGTYDDKNVRSSGSIGGGTRAHDAQEPRDVGPGLDNPLPPRTSGIEMNREPDEKRRDDEFRSGGSFGGSRS